MTTTTDNMSLILGTVSDTLGPQWAALINAALQLVDAHDHTSGAGVPITPAALLINDAVEMDGEDLEAAGSVSLVTKGAADTAKVGSIQQVGDDLYWVSGAGAAVKLTSGGSVVSSGSGAMTLTTPSAYPYAVTTGDAQSVIAVDTSAARTLTLPAATNAMYCIVKDASGLAATNNITITPDGTDTLEGVNSSYTVDANRAAVGLISDGVSAWHVV